MVTFRVGDIVTLCISMRDFCGSEYQLYTVNDLDCAIDACPVLSTPFNCLSPSGIAVTFQWTNSTENGCTSLNNLKTLGTSTTNSVGIATLQYTITQNDLDIFNIAVADTDYNGMFDLRVCYDKGGNVGGIYSVLRGKVDNIVIQSGLQPTHIIKYDIGDWEYANLLEEYIVDFSRILIPLVPKTNPNITYIKTEYNKVENCIDVYVAYTGTVLVAPYATVPGELEITDWGMLALIVLSMALSILLFIVVAPVLAAGGPITWTILASLLVALGLFFVSAYNIYHIISTSRTATQIAENLAISQFQDNSFTQTKDDLLKLCAENKIDKSDYYNALKEASMVYANKAKAEFPLIEIQSEFDAFKICADNLITNFNINDDCGILLNNMNTCSLPLVEKIQSEKLDKYASGTYVPPPCSSHLVKEVCDADSTCIWSYEECISKKSCIIINPLDNTCMLSTDNLWKGMPYIIGVGAIGAVAFMYAPGVIGFVGGGMNEWSKTLGTKPTEEKNKKQV